MSISTTMKFIVKGKSVDFINREGSSPSIPNKNKFYFLTFSAPLVVQNSLHFTFTLLFPDEFKQIWSWIDTIYVQIYIYGQVIPIMESFIVRIIILTLIKESLLFLRPKRFQGRKYDENRT